MKPRQRIHEWSARGRLAASQPGPRADRRATLCVARWAGRIQLQLSCKAGCSRIIHERRSRS